MPKFLEDRLAQGARKAGLKGRKADAYIYGYMNKQGYMRGNKETAKGRALDRKHQRDQRSQSAKREHEPSAAKAALDHRYPSHR